MPTLYWGPWPAKIRRGGPEFDIMLVYDDLSCQYVAVNKEFKMSILSSVLFNM